MDKQVLIHVRGKFESAGITNYTIEFNNNYSINAGYEGHYVTFDDDAEVIWDFGPRTNKYQTGHKMEVRCFSYSEVQFFRAGLDFKDAINMRDNIGCKITAELTEIIKKLCGVTDLSVPRYRSAQELEESDGGPELLNGMPSCRPGL